MSRIEREVLQVQEKTKLLEYYRQMLAIRRIEEAAAKAYSQGGKIGGFLHLYIGQEAVAVGACASHHTRRCRSWRGVPRAAAHSVSFQGSGSGAHVVWLRRTSCAASGAAARASTAATRQRRVMRMPPWM